ncbi:membrane protein [Gordonia phage MichaelScott]|uniref:Membrane protein n=1 Tax=Gordonia phage MichaelScott TaxID=2759395 RepID=A0A7L7SQL9_9CAUD|nr:membrane protein [Gordonia phage MichaelScott]QOC56274.1 membrane protein [Gordonia phage MichaelScott]
MTTRRDVYLLLGIVVTGLLVGVTITEVGLVYDAPLSARIPDIRPLVLCVCLVAMATVSYIGWPSRWNVIAHGQLAFAVVAYVIPILVLRRLDGLQSEAVDLYYRVALVGAVMMLAGALIGSRMSRTHTADRLRARARFDTRHVREAIASRTFIVCAVAVAMICIAFAVMGFVPMLAEDPMQAKFFKGPYAAAYAPVAPLYRFGTTVIALLLPLLGAYAWQRRTAGWVLLFAAAAGAMSLGLMREPAVTGILLLIGLVLAAKGRGLPLYFGLLLGVYFVGSALYFFLGKVGVQGFGADPRTAGRPFLDEVAAGAPDVADQVSFLRAWQSFPQYTDGKTWLGGLVPGNFEWNPSVWSLSVVNPGVPIDEITSGGLRLPAPIWGLVSFGWPGVVLVSLLAGFAFGYLARLASRLVPSKSLVTSVSWLMLYAAALDIFPVFYRLSYLSVIQFAVVVMLLFWIGTPKARIPVGAPSLTPTYRLRT